MSPPTIRPRFALWLVRHGPTIEVGCGVVLLIGLAALVVLFVGALAKYP